jgi:hypothetical protein
MKYISINLQEKNIQICTNYIGIKLESYHEALEENDRT